MSAPSTLTFPELPDSGSGPTAAPLWALVIAWSASEPQRVGQVALLDAAGSPWILGRAPESRPPDQQNEESPVRFFCQRPAGLPRAERPEDAPTAVEGEYLSRRQLCLRPGDQALYVENIGRCQLSVNGQRGQQFALQAGDTLLLQDQLLLLCTRRPRELPPLRHYPAERVGGFGQADRDGILGESPVIWRLRDHIAMYAKMREGVLITGPSGSGKELAAQALHTLSDRCGRPLIEQNVSAILPSLAAALLFGNRRSFPNPGSEERQGLIGAADRSSLFLDEIGDMPEEIQPVFLRVLETGQYMRLGEEGVLKRSDFRLIGATNHPERLRCELERRFEYGIEIPGLQERREDIPLLIRHLLLKKQANKDPDVQGYVRGGRVEISPALVRKLLLHPYRTHVAELKKLLARALKESDGSMLRPWSSAPHLSAPDGGRPTPSKPSVVAQPLPRPEVAQEALDRCRGNVRSAASELGISRDQLNRMITRHKLKLSRG